MSRTVLVSGATGTVGSRLVRTLAGAGVQPRAFVRDRDKARALLGDETDLVVGDFADHDVVRSALDEVDAFFLACGNVPGQVDLERAAIDAARSAGVSRLVKLSARGAAHAAPAAVWRGHAVIEDHLAASGLGAVVLRPSFYMSNLLAATAPVRHGDALPAAAGTAPIAMIDPDDVAAVAARALLDDAISGVLELSGPEALSYHQVAQQLSRLVGRHITYLAVSPEEAGRAMVASGMPAAAAAQVLEIFAALRHGAYATTTDGVPRTIGRPARTLEEFLHEHLSAFADVVLR